MQKDLCFESSWLEGEYRKQRVTRTGCLHRRFEVVRVVSWAIVLAKSRVISTMAHAVGALTSAVLLLLPDAGKRPSSTSALPLPEATARATVCFMWT